MNLTMVTIARKSRVLVDKNGCLWHPTQRRIEQRAGYAMKTLWVMKGYNARRRQADGRLTWRHSFTSPSVQEPGENFDPQKSLVTKVQAIAERNGWSFQLTGIRHGTPVDLHPVEELVYALEYALEEDREVAE